MRQLWSVGGRFAHPVVDPTDTSPRASTEPAAVKDVFAANEVILRRENDLGGETSRWINPAVSAVMLGVLGVGTLAGASIVRAETNPTGPVDAGNVDPAVRDAAAALDGARESMSAEELSRARDHLWRSFANSTQPATHVVTLPLRGGVGPGQPNRVEDLQAVRARLSELGFPVGTGDRLERTTERGLRLFEALVTGREGLSGTSGRVQPGGPLHNALSAPDAPRWVKLPMSGPGFINDDHDGFSHGTDRLAGVIKDSGQRYADNYLLAHPDSARMSLNDASRKDGGPNRDHETHEIGLDLDIRLPKKDGTSGSNVLWREYDRSATFAMIEAFAKDPRVERVLTSDRTLLREIEKSSAPWKHKVVYGGSSHRNHLHIDVSPPAAPELRMTT